MADQDRGYVAASNAGCYRLDIPGDPIPLPGSVAWTIVTWQLDGPHHVPSIPQGTRHLVPTPRTVPGTMNKQEFSHAPAR